MYSQIIDIILINIIVTYIIDHSGIVTSISKALWGKGWQGQIIIKPFSCAVCMTFWLTIIYSLFFFQIITSIAIGVTSAIAVRRTSSLISYLLYY